MSRHRIFYFCYDHDKPTGGQKDTYRHVDALNDAGFEAYVVHSSPGVRLMWFENSTRIVDASTFFNMFDERNDYLVVPEDLGPSIIQMHGRKVIFNKGIYNGFTCFGRTQQTPYPYLHPDVVAAMVVSDHNAEHLRFTYPKLPIYRVCSEIDTGLFVFRRLAAKKRQIAFVPKAHSLVMTLFHMLQSRAAAGLNGLAQFEWVAIADMSEAEVATALGDALLLVFLSVEEGLPRTPLEAMACGCLIAAYDSGPIVESVPPQFCFRPGNLVDIAHYIEAIIEAYPDRLDEWQGHAIAGLERARSFSAESQKNSLVDVWDEICSGRGRERC